MFSAGWLTIILLVLSLVGALAFLGARGRVSKFKFVKRRRGFFPTIDPDNGGNYFKRHFNIHRDGSVTECVFLDIPDSRIREQIICFHYLGFVVTRVVKGDVEFNFVSRDKPWDFRIETSLATALNVEITAIADNPFQHEVNKREHVLGLLSGQKEVPSHKLTKLKKWFPDMDFDDASGSEKKVSRVTDGPTIPSKHRLFISTSFPPEDSLSGLIQKGIEKKAQKNHPEKNITVLILDNHTMEFGPVELAEAIQTLQVYLQKAPFEEIWFYTGYFSELNSTNAEFSFVPIKLPEQLRSHFEIGESYQTYVPLVEELSPFDGIS